MNHFFIKNEINIGMSNADRDCTAGLQQNPTIMPLRPAFRLVAYKVVVTHEVFVHNNNEKMVRLRPVPEEEVGRESPAYTEDGRCAERRVVRTMISKCQIVQAQGFAELRR